MFRWCAVLVTCVGLLARGGKTDKNGSACEGRPQGPWSVKCRTVLKKNIRKKDKGPFLGTTLEDEGQFMCLHGFCTPKEFRCNGIKNCHDGSDEKDCPRAVHDPCLEEIDGDYTDSADDSDAEFVPSTAEPTNSTKQKENTHDRTESKDGGKRGHKDAEGKCQPWCSTSEDSWSSKCSLPRCSECPEAVKACRGPDTEGGTQEIGKEGIPKIPDGWFQVPDRSICDGHHIERGQCDNIGCDKACEVKDCEWSDWEETTIVGHCTGLTQFKRTIKQQPGPKSCPQSKPCSGPELEGRQDLEEHSWLQCVQGYGDPVDCMLSEWYDWGSCSDKLLGQHSRTRSVLTPSQFGGKACEGSMEETEVCGSNEITNCVFGDWQEWTACSKTCGGGRQIRSRGFAAKASAVGEACVGGTWATRVCNMESCDLAANCLMGEWSDWQGCGEAPGLAKKIGFNELYREREVSVGAKAGGTGCEGALQELVGGCGGREAHAPMNCTLSEWGDWADCDRSCGGGQTQRLRRVIQDAGDCGGCPETELSQAQACNTDSCGGSRKELDCVLGEWAEWSACSADCGNGVSVRSREVLREMLRGGKACVGNLGEAKECRGTKCTPIDCVWADWEDWDGCSKTCGGGTKRRSRVVAVSNSPQGKTCDPEHKGEVMECNTVSCEHRCMDGRWSSWSLWGSCTVSCGGGYQVRSRDVEVHPNTCGKPAVGPTEEYQLCSRKACDTDEDCALTTWSAWSDCSCDCFGVRERTRVIERFAKGNGKLCGGDSLKDLEPCNPSEGETPPANCLARENQVDCKLSEWTLWSACPVDCGGGQRTRSRTVLAQAMNGGKQCKGGLEEIDECANLPCEKTCIDCKWGLWSEWDACPPCGGQRTRHRNIMQLPNACGEKCDGGSAKEVDDCPSIKACTQDRWCVWSTWTTFTPCEDRCGAAQLRQRTLSFTDSEPEDGEDGALFKASTTHMTCAGTQLEAVDCNSTETNPQCQTACKREGPITCKWGIWSDWTEPNCQGLCERHREISRLNNECAKPCTGPTVDTKKCEPQCRHEMEWRFSQWSAWTDCVAGVAQSYRERHVEMYDPAAAGGAVDTTSDETPGQVDGHAKRLKGGDLQGRSTGPWSVKCRTVGIHIKKKDKEPKLGTILEKEGYFMCMGGFCTPKKHHCDGVKNCHDGSDEKGCPGGDPSLGESDGDYVDSESDDEADFRPSSRTASDDETMQGEPNDGDLKETRSCNVLLQKQDCELTAWSGWEPCSKTCGGGHTLRYRQFDRRAEGGGLPCDDVALQELMECNSGCCVGSVDADCEFSEWDEWSPCGRDLQMVRERHVKVKAEGNGQPCDGEVKELKPCDSDPIDCVMSDWAKWGPCTTTCGTGQQRYHRSIETYPQHGGKRCDETQIMTDRCDLAECEDHAIDCAFSEWAPWGACSSPCGPGQQERARKVAVYPKGEGEGCEGPLDQVQQCSNAECPTARDCVPGDWEDWSGCSATCGQRHRTRQRLLPKPALFGGKPCEDHSLIDVEACEYLSCEAALKGKECDVQPFIDWSEWGLCSATCGRGKQGRARRPKNIPQKTLTACGSVQTGEMTEWRDCSDVEECEDSKDCVLTKWHEGMECLRYNFHTKLGFTLRTREIAEYREGHGKPCADILRESIPCEVTEEEGAAPLPKHTGGATGAVKSGPMSVKCNTVLKTKIKKKDKKPYLGKPVPNEGYFMCMGGFCTPQEYRCDGVKNCHDGSDERGCAGGSTETLESDGDYIDTGGDDPDFKAFVSGTGSAATTQVLGRDVAAGEGGRKGGKNSGPWSVKCREVLKNPIKKKDKGQYLGKVIESEGMFMCMGGFCTPKEHRCNGIKNCHDGSDEKGCTGGDLSLGESDGDYVDQGDDDSEFVSKHSGTLGTETKSTANVDCVMSDWSPWTACSAGSKIRERVVAVAPENDGAPCEGNLKEVTHCDLEEKILKANENTLRHAVLALQVNGYIPAEAQLWNVPGDGQPVLVCDAAQDCGQTTYWRHAVTSGGDQRKQFMTLHYLDANYKEDGSQVEVSIKKGDWRGNVGNSFYILKAFDSKHMDLSSDIDCLLSDWLEWSKCDCDKDQRNRDKIVLQQPRFNGKACHPIDMRETGACPRFECKDAAKEEVLWCYTTDWKDWGECSTTCGLGSRERTRSFQIAKPDLIDKMGLTDFSDHRALLRQMAQLHDSNLERNVRHQQEIIVAFSAGMLSLMVMFAAVRFVQRRSPVATAYGVVAEAELGDRTRSTPFLARSQATHLEIE